MTHDSARREAALDWLVRTNDPEFEGWAEFTAWLEADAGNADAYHALADSELRMRPLAEELPAQEVPAPRPARRGMAIAASVAALAALATAVVAPRLMPVDYSTGPGEMRIVSFPKRFPDSPSA